jgi:hypothetical protein
VGHLAERNRERRQWKPRCIYCRKELKKHTLDWWEAHDEGTMPVPGAVVSYAAVCDVDYGMRRYLIRQVLHCRGETGKRRVRYWLGHWGYEGNGRFCSTRCGYEYAVKSAGPLLPESHKEAERLHEDHHRVRD